MKPEVLAFVRLAPPYREQLAADFEVTELTEFEPSQGGELPESVRGVRALVTTGGRHGAPEWLIDSLPNLEIIACHSVGFNAVDVQAARRKGIVVTHAPGVLTDDVADYAMALMLAGMRRLPAADRFVRSGQWAAGNIMPICRGVHGSTVSILGLGRIGRAIATRAVAFGMQPIYCDVTRFEDVPYPFFEDLKAMAAAADVLMVSCAGNDRTRRIVDRPVLDALGPDGMLVNVARGMIVDEEALVAALAEGHLGFACLDAFENEPAVPQALFDMENVILSPHLASGTAGAREGLARMVVENLSSYFAGMAVPNPVT